jgi:diadenylate cyclase
MNELSKLLNHADAMTWAKDIFQILVICYAALWLWRRIAGTHAERLVKGMFILIAISFVSAWLKLTIITSILHHIIPAAALALVIVFQPEIRRGLGHLGRVKSFKFDLTPGSSDPKLIKNNIRQIILAVKELARTKTGALIVIEPPEGERDYVSPGTALHANISATLLLTLFFPKSPLHDGAVVIQRDKIVAAGVILPMTDNPQISYKYGTRHRAAIGLSETYEGLCIVVSEETGAISAASRGMLARYSSAEDLIEPITYLYERGPASDGPLNSFLSLFGRGAVNATSSNANSGASAGHSADSNSGAATENSHANSAVNITVAAETD